MSSEKPYVSAWYGFVLRKGGKRASKFHSSAESASQHEVELVDFRAAGGCKCECRAGLKRA